MSHCEPLQKRDGGVDSGTDDASASVRELPTAFSPAAGSSQQVPVDVRVQELALALRERRSDLGQPDRDSRQGLVALRQRAEVYERVAQRVDLDRRDDRVEGYVGLLDTCRDWLAQDLRPAVVPAEPLHYRAGTLGLRQQGDQRLQGQRDQAVGLQIIRRAIEEPMRWIAMNAGQEGSIIVSKVKEQKNADEGFNAATEIYEDLVKAGVIDPAKVTRAALQNAASIAALLLTTEVLVVEKKEPAPAMPGGGMPDMGGMGGMGGMM